MIRRREFMGLLGGTAWPFAAGANIAWRRIGYLTTTPKTDR